MDLNKLANNSDEKLKAYTIALREDMTAPYKCFWTNDIHRGCTQTKGFNYVRHIIACPHREEYINNNKSTDQPMRFPIYEEDYENYRSSLHLMNGCYEFQVERLGVPGWRSYNNRLETLMLRFFGQYCNMGRSGFQQSVIYNGSKWKVKKNEDSPFIILDSGELFDFFVDEFKPLLEEQLNKGMEDSSSYEFWYFMIKGKRTMGQRSRMKQEQDILDSPPKTKIVGEHIVEPGGKIVFISKNGTPLYRKK